MAAGCGTVPRGAGPDTGPGNRTEMMRSVSTYNEAESTLMQAYREWKGTPYELGGADRNGVDCSRFVQIVFDDYFGRNLPPNTWTQMEAGQSIRRGSLRTGDLVFFRTGRQTLHVGIITDGDEFMHASTSSGVMISSLSETYWSSRYLASRRVM